MTDIPCPLCSQVYPIKIKSLLAHTRVLLASWFLICTTLHHKKNADENQWDSTEGEFSTPAEAQPDIFGILTSEPSRPGSPLNPASP